MAKATSLPDRDPLQSGRVVCPRCGAEKTWRRGRPWMCESCRLAEPPELQLEWERGNDGYVEKLRAKLGT